MILKLLNKAKPVYFYEYVAKFFIQNKIKELIYLKSSRLEAKEKKVATVKGKKKISSKLKKLYSNSNEANSVSSVKIQKQILNYIDFDLKEIKLNIIKDIITRNTTF